MGSSQAAARAQQRPARSFQPPPERAPQLPYRVRPYAGESAFVAGTWLSSYASSPWGRRVTRDEFFANHVWVVNALIEHAKIFVAESTHEESQGLLLGWICGERDQVGPIVHYAYMKGDFRTQGMMRTLCRSLLDVIQKSDGERVRYTHSRAPGCEIAERKGWEYTPYPALRHGWQQRGK